LEEDQEEEGEEFDYYAYDQMGDDDDEVFSDSSDDEQSEEAQHARATLEECCKAAHESFSSAMDVFEGQMGTTNVPLPWHTPAEVQKAFCLAVITHSFRLHPDKNPDADHRVFATFMGAYEHTWKVLAEVAIFPASRRQKPSWRICGCACGKC
jgi:hypothetical protein